MSVSLSSLYFSKCLRPSLITFAFHEIGVSSSRHVLENTWLYALTMDPKEHEEWVGEDPANTDIPHQVEFGELGSLERTT